MSSSEALAVEVKDNVAQVTLLGPGKGNAMGPAFWDEMPVLFAELDADPEVRAIVLTGSGRNFCFGLDLMAMGGTLPSMGGWGGECTTADDVPHDRQEHAAINHRGGRLPNTRPSHRSTAGASAAGWI